MSVKSKLEILNEIADYYNEDPSRRGIDENGDCMYWVDKLSESGEYKMCAVGYCLGNPENAKGIIGGVQSLNFSDELKLKPEYEIDDLDFWDDLQGFHDDPVYWRKEGLTLEGNKELSRLRKKYEEDRAA